MHRFGVCIGRCSRWLKVVANAVLGQREKEGLEGEGFSRAGRVKVEVLVDFEAGKHELGVVGGKGGLHLHGIEGNG